MLSSNSDLTATEQPVKGHCAQNGNAIVGDPGNAGSNRIEKIEMRMQPPIHPRPVPV